MASHSLTTTQIRVITDPIGELMEKLIAYMRNRADSKFVQRDGNPTMAGWGWLKSTMRTFLKTMCDSGKHIVIVAHVQEKDDDGLIKRPMVATRLSEELSPWWISSASMTTINDTETGDTGA